MNKIYIITSLFFLIISSSLYSQDHVSQDNYSGDWSSPLSWAVGDGN